MTSRAPRRPWQPALVLLLAAAATAGCGPGLAGPTATPPTGSRSVASGPTPPVTTPAPAPPTSASAPAPTSSGPAPGLSTTRPAPPAGCAQGERQREVEGYLAQLGGFGPVSVDGIQSAADCAAIKRFQQRYGISPAQGRAGATTADVARRLAATRIDQCPAGPGTTICLNLTLQTVWVVRDGAVLMRPTVTRTGMAGYATPAGTFRVTEKAMREWSQPYSVWLPYWQRFYDGMGFHETTTYLHDGSIGSHGCVNLLHSDAVALWGLTVVGTRVSIFGRRPGT